MVDVANRFVEARVPQTARMKRPARNGEAAGEGRALIGSLAALE
jgi:hypothetical protein